MSVVLFNKFHYHFSRNSIYCRHHACGALVSHFTRNFCFSFAGTLADVRAGSVAVKILLHRILSQLVALRFDEPHSLRFFQFLFPVQEHPFRREKSVVFVERESMDFVQVGSQIRYGTEKSVTVIFRAGDPVVGSILRCFDIMALLQVFISVAVSRVRLATQMTVENFLGCCTGAGHLSFRTNYRPNPTLIFDPIPKMAAGSWKKKRGKRSRQSKPPLPDWLNSLSLYPFHVSIIFFFSDSVFCRH